MSKSFSFIEKHVLFLTFYIKDIGWLRRVQIRNSPWTTIFEKDGSQAFTYKIRTPTKEMDWINIHLDQPYVGKYVDDYKHRVFNKFVIISS
jgi:hypothetical protein